MKIRLALAFFLLSATACTLAVTEPGPPPTSPGKGPPPWAPAHGFRAKARHYYYYPSSSVYFDVERQVYFYLSGGEWRMSVSLPPAIVLEPAAYVDLDLDTDEPYRHYDEHRTKYKTHKEKKHKDKDDDEDDDRGRGRGHGKGRD